MLTGVVGPYSYFGVVQLYDHAFWSFRVRMCLFDWPCISTFGLRCMCMLLGQSCWTVYFVRGVEVCVPSCVNAFCFVFLNIFSFVLKALPHKTRSNKLGTRVRGCSPWDGLVYKNNNLIPLLVLPAIYLYGDVGVCISSQLMPSRWSLCTCLVWRTHIYIYI